MMLNILSFSSVRCLYFLCIATIVAIRHESGS